jgi:hypothetical protein
VAGKVTGVYMPIIKRQPGTDKIPSCAACSPARQWGAAAVFKGADADEQMEIKREKWLLQKPWTPRVSESWSLSKSNEVQ